MSTEELRTKQTDEIFCPNCGVPIKQNAVICVHCGVAISSRFRLAKLHPLPKNTVAVFVLGLLSLVLWPLAIISLALSVRGFREVKDGAARPSGMFTAGRICSVVSLALLLSIVVMSIFVGLIGP